VLQDGQPIHPHAEDSTRAGRAAALLRPGQKGRPLEALQESEGTGPASTHMRKKLHSGESPRASPTWAQRPTLHWESPSYPQIGSQLGGRAALRLGNSTFRLQAEALRASPTVTIGRVRPQDQAEAFLGALPAGGLRPALLHCSSFRYFHSPCRVLCTFRSPYLCNIGHQP